MNDDDRDLDAWLAAPQPGIADDGFTAAVMRRVRAEQVALQAPVLDAPAALARLARCEAIQRRRSRWLAGGVTVGAVVALLTLLASTAPTAFGPPQTLALLVGLCAAAWALIDDPNAGSA